MATRRPPPPRPRPAVRPTPIARSNPSFVTSRTPPILYNSFPFLFAFLPLTLALYYALARARLARVALAALAGASLFFYAWWDWHNLVLLAGSILVNFAAGALLKRRRSFPALAAAVTLNLLLLGYYKYAHFLLSTLHLAHLVPDSILSRALPLGISFFTFTQIAFLVDCYNGLAAELNFTRYLLFVTFFPHIIAGPIVHHRDLMPQFADPANRRWRPDILAPGVALFCLGLAKKVILADTVGPWASAVFDAPSFPHLPAATAWFAALAYTFQLYFDFSGYSDMAVGLALLFNVRMPDNFDAPYRAASPVDFWARWHITLSRFLRDYLYIPLGGNRKGKPRRYANLLLTMALGGLWHGAGWTYVLWGLYHGLLLCLVHAYRALTGKHPPKRPTTTEPLHQPALATLHQSPHNETPARPDLLQRVERADHSEPHTPATALAPNPDACPTPRPTPALLAPRFATFAAVVLGWVLFRSPTLPRALTFLHAMLLPLHRDTSTTAVLDLPTPTPLQWTALAALFAFVNLAPTSLAWLRARPLTPRRAVFLALLFVTSVLLIRDAHLAHKPNLFIYFQF